MSTNIIEFRVPGPMVGKERARVTRRGTYTPQKTLDYEEKIRTYCMKEWRARGGLINYDPNGWFVVGFEFYHRYAELFPDADNIMKCACDALQGRIWYNDKHVIPRAWRAITNVGKDCGMDISIHHAGEYEHHEYVKAKKGMERCYK